MSKFKSLISDRHTFIWLAVFAILNLFTSGKWVIAPLVWIASIFALRFVRGQKVWKGMLLIWLATFVPQSIAWWGLQPEPMPDYLFFMAAVTAFGVVPFLLDRLLATRLGSRFAATLIFPLSATVFEYVSMSGFSPYGSFGASGYTQVSIPVIMQLAAITGLWGITFLINWFASVVVWAWEQDFNWQHLRLGASVYTFILLLVVFYGAGRLLFAPDVAETVTVTSFTVAETHAGELFALLAEDEAAFRAQTAATHNTYLERTVQAAREGAEIVMWPELAGFGLEADVLALIERGRTLAREEGIYLAMPVFIIFPDRDRLIENKLYIADPNGEIVIEHVKYGGNALEGTLKGNEVLQAVDTPYGRLSGIICWDTDYQWVVTQIGQMDVDILLSPSLVWEEMGPMHAAMATFRAVENGVVVVRQEDQGRSLAVDAHGRTLAIADHFDGERVLQVDVPVDSSVTTVYPQMGDLVGGLAQLGLLVMAVWAIIAGRISKKEVASQEAY